MPVEIGLQLSIRNEQAGDAPIIEGVIKRAYDGVLHSDHREHVMVERLRVSAAYLPELSLLAEAERQVVGHVLLTKALIRDGEAATPTLALAPLSIVPEWQRQGVGKALVREAHEVAARMGFASIVLVGPPAYYHRFGYQPLSLYPIALPFDAPEANRLILALSEESLMGVRGTVDYAKEWLNH